MGTPTFTLRKLKAADVTFTVEVEREEDDIRGHFASGDDEADRKLERDIQRAVNRGDVEAWCILVVKATWNGFEGVDTLGGCSFLTGDGYGDTPVDEQIEQHRRDHGMYEQALEYLNQHIARVAAQIAPLCGSDSDPNADGDRF